jgi:hypothetical protein
MARETAITKLAAARKAHSAALTVAAPHNLQAILHPEDRSLPGAYEAGLACDLAEIALHEAEAEFYLWLGNMPRALEYQHKAYDLREMLREVDEIVGQISQVLSPPVCLN